MSLLENTWKNRVLFGVVASAGIIGGESMVVQTETRIPKKRKAENVEEELYQLEEGRAKIEQTLKQLCEYAKELRQKTTIDILEAQNEIINDPELLKGIRRLIEEEGLTSDYAVYEMFNDYIEMLQGTGSEAFLSRVVDLKDLRDRLIRELQNKDRLSAAHTALILVADNLSPTQMMEWVKAGVKGIVLAKGGQNAHASIVANSLQIPMLIQTGKSTLELPDRSPVLLDALEGRLLVEPEPDEEKVFQERLLCFQKRKLDLSTFEKKQTLTKDGYRIKLQGNIELLEESGSLIQYGLEGVGLLRTESLLLYGNNYSEEGLQQAFFEKIAKATQGQPVTVRLFDIGGDKLLGHKNNEANPFLGWRGIRLLLKRTELMRSQLSAVLKASEKFSKGTFRLLLPMVSTLDEIKAFYKEFHRHVEFLRPDHPEADYEMAIGVMVEVPSVVTQIEQFASQVDFLSIGTNDLTQYTFAVDRTNHLVADLYQQLHPVMFSQIERVIVAGKKVESEVSVCGQLASDPFGAAILVGLGVDALSVVPTRSSEVKELLSSLTMNTLRRLSKQVLNMETVGEVRKLKREVISETLSDI